MSKQLEDLAKRWEMTGDVSVVVDIISYAEELEEKILAVKPNREKPFKKPTLDQLQDYADKIGYDDFHPQAFIDFYDTKNWFVGKTKMKSWKGAVRTWKNRAHPPGPKPEAPLPEVTPAMKYFWDAQDITSAMDRNEKFNMLLESKFRQLPPEHKNAIITKYKELKANNSINGTWSQLCPP